MKVGRCVIWACQALSLLDNRAFLIGHRCGGPESLAGPSLYEHGILVELDLEEIRHLYHPLLNLTVWSKLE